MSTSLSQAFDDGYRAGVARFRGPLMWLYRLLKRLDGAIALSGARNHRHA